MRIRHQDGPGRGRLRRAALRFADHGWEVIPGAYLVGGRFACGPVCPVSGCHPATRHGEALLGPARGCRDRAAVAHWWRERPFAVLLATGITFDVLELPAPLGLAAVRARVRGPVATADTGRCLVWLRTGDRLRPELAVMPGVVLHGAGSWVPAPPTRFPRGALRWLVPPAAVDWHIPPARDVQSAVVAALPEGVTGWRTAA